MEIKDIREEKAVDSLIALLKQGNHKKAKLKLGELRGKPGEFMGLFEYLTQNTALEGFKLKITPVRARVKCLSCDWKGDPDIKPNGVRCPRCMNDVEILNGHEFSVEL